MLTVVTVFVFAFSTNYSMKNAKMRFYQKSANRTCRNGTIRAFYKKTETAKPFSRIYSSVSNLIRIVVRYGKRFPKNVVRFGTEKIRTPYCIIKEKLISTNPEE